MLDRRSDGDDPTRVEDASCLGGELFQVGGDHDRGQPGAVDAIAAGRIRPSLDVPGAADAVPYPGVRAMPGIQMGQLSTGVVVANPV